MKKYAQYILSAAVVALLLTACQKDNERTVTLTAVVADQPNLGGEAKVYVNETGGVVYGCWQQNDSVLLNDEGHQVVVNSPSSTTASITEIDYSESGYTAGYPYQHTTHKGTGNVVITLPAVQPYQSANIYGSGAGEAQWLPTPMAAYCPKDGSTLQFHNVGAVMKITVSNSYDETLTLHAVEVESESAEAPLAGTCDVTVGQGGISSVTYTGSSQRVTLDLSGVTKTLANGQSLPLYIPVLPIDEDKASKITIHVYAKGKPVAEGPENKYTFHGKSAGTVWMDRNQMGAVSVELSSANKTANDPYFWGQGNSYCPFLIESKEDFITLRNIVARIGDFAGVDNDDTYNNSGIYYKQTSNVDISDSTQWGQSGGHYAVGTTAHPFAANYDGGGCSVELRVTSAVKDYPVGVFGTISDGAVICNLTSKGSINIGTILTWAGGIVGKITGNATIRNCTNKCAVTSTSTTTTSSYYYSYGVAGICAMVDASGCSIKIAKCNNEGEIRADANTTANGGGIAAGGVVAIGKTATILNIDTCGNTQSVHSKHDINGDGSSYWYGHYSGGIMAYQAAACTTSVSYCTNAGEIIGVNGVGGIVGYSIGKLSISGTTSNSGRVNAGAADYSFYAGGIVGYHYFVGSSDGDDLLISGTTTNSGSIEGRSCIGGIVGLNKGRKMQLLGTIGNTNTGSISIRGTGDTACMGGLVGADYAGVRIEGIAYNNGRINGTSLTNNNVVKNRVGGILGYTKSYLTFATNAQVTNSGIITGKESVGGIAGWVAQFLHTNTGNQVENTSDGTVSGQKYVGGCFGQVKIFSTSNAETISIVNRADVTGTDYYVGGIVGYNTSQSATSGSTFYTDIKGCTNHGDIQGTYNVGGIVGYSYSRNTTNCTNYGQVTATTQQSAAGVGGIIGKVNNSTTFTGCSNCNNVTGIDNVGGLVGYSAYAITFSGTNTNTNTAVVTGTYYSENGSYGIGGIVGYTSGTLTVRGNVVNNGTIDGFSTAQHLGGIFGYLDGALTIDAEGSAANTGAIRNFVDRSGGIVGHLNKAATISGRLTNSGNVTGTGCNIGGIVGAVTTGALTINSSATVSNSSPIIGGYNVGGILGFTNKDLTLNNCTNTGNITVTATVSTDSTYAVAGIVARINNKGGNITLNKCKNTGVVRSSANCSKMLIGGIAGYTNTQGTIYNCYNSGSLTGNEYFIGGIVARTQYGLTVSNCYNSGSMSGTLASAGACGGIVGRSFTYSTGTVGTKVNNCYNSGTFDISGATAYSIASVAASRKLYLYNCYGVPDIDMSNTNSDNIYRCATFNSESGVLTPAVTVNSSNTAAEGTTGSYSTLKAALDAWVTKQGGTNYVSWGSGTLPSLSL